MMFSLKRLNDETGFSLLLSIVILFVLTSVLLHTLSLYENEKQFAAMEKESTTLEHLIISSVIYVLSEMEQENDEDLVEGMLEFFEGSVQYERYYSDGKYNVTIRAYLKSGRGKRVQFTYLADTKKIENWIEGVQLS